MQRESMKNRESKENIICIGCRKEFSLENKENGENRARIFGWEEKKNKLGGVFWVCGDCAQKNIEEL
jgi:hypothetical protein